MTHSYFRLNRLRITRGGKAAYDEQFHSGVNIIRGENGSGKSTIADFIFYALGGEFEDWKAMAKLCEEVQAEIATRGGVVTVRRSIDKKLSPAWLFFGAMDDANAHALDGWKRCPIRRQENYESFSQLMFRSSGIPEAQSEGASNVTMHQIMRLLYSDQRTPAPRLFRFELFDTKEIKEAVGNLVCGLNIYEAYELQLRLRALEKSYEEKQIEFSRAMAAFPTEEGSATMAAIELRVAQADHTRNRLEAEISSVDELIDADSSAEFLSNRREALRKLTKEKEALRAAEERLGKVSLDLADLRQFIAYLHELSNKLPNAESASKVVGNIEFTYCPSCLSPLASQSDAGHCIVCGTATDPAKEQSRYLQIKLDIDVQLRESRQLEAERELSQRNIEAEVRETRRRYAEEMTTFALHYDTSNAPRESFLAERHHLMGNLDTELKYLQRLREIAREIERLSGEKAEIQKAIEQVKDRKIALENQGRQRRQRALTQISDAACSILARDLPRQEEFKAAKSVALEFGDDAVIVDGAMNFAESSNVILKNTAIAALFSSAVSDEAFFHPRFILLDNVEDKGMETARSHNFQHILIGLSNAARLEHQIIFTTSMIAPDLDVEKYVVGPKYSHDRRTLSFA